MKSCEASPLLNRSSRSKVAKLSLATLAIFSISFFLINHKLQRREMLISTSNAANILRVPRSEILYQDWRGLAQEEEDTFSFVHTWSGSVVVGEQEEHFVDPDSLTIQFLDQPAKNTEGVPGPGASLTSRTKTQLEGSYNIFLVGNGWSEGMASALLKQMDDLCGAGLSDSKTSLSCDLDEKTMWTLKSELIPDDVVVDGYEISISNAAFEYAQPRKATLNGTTGSVVSRRLLHAVMHALTDHGTRAEVVDRLLRRLFNATIEVDIGYTSLTDVTTYEDRGRFMAFRPRELMYMLESWSLTPKHLYVVPGLRYVTRRQQGLNHPYYGSTTAVSWPANRPVSYQEYMDYSFNNDGYTSRHLFLHEKSHFFWDRVWPDAMRRDWSALGRWTLPGGEDPSDAGDSGWATSSSTSFVSDYGAGNNPNEDMAEDLAAYVLHPRLLRARSPDKFDFISRRIMEGTEYLEHAPFGATLPESAGPFLRYPPIVKKVVIRVSGKPSDDKSVTVRMLLDAGKGWRSPVHAQVSLSGPTSGSHTLTLQPVAGAGSGDDVGEGEVALETVVQLSRFMERGFWTAKQMTVEDERGKQRWIMVDDFSWRLYLNNAQGTSWAPRVLKDTTRVEVASAVDPASGKAVPKVTAVVRYQQTGAPLATTPIWMRLAAHGLPPGGGASLDYAQWAADSGAADGAYPVYAEAKGDRAERQGSCKADWEGHYDGVCRVEWTLSPHTPTGLYYVAMLRLQDVGANKRSQFFTVQRPGWTCCGRTGNTPDDEPPALAALRACPASGAQAGGAACVDPDTAPPELDLGSIRVGVEAPRAGSRGTVGVVTASFRARDDKAGLGQVRYRLLDPQGSSHEGYVKHDNSGAGPVFLGDAGAWVELGLRLELPEGSPPGRWALESLQLQDKAGNRRDFQLVELLHFQPDHPHSQALRHRRRHHRRRGVSLPARPATSGGRGGGGDWTLPVPLA